MLLIIMCCDLEVTDRRMTPAIKLVFAPGRADGCPSGPPTDPYVRN